jgi:putative Holliday junction resolvase
MSELTRLLAIDYGEKRIGLALSDAMRMFAKPFDTIPNISFENTLQRLNEVIIKQRVGLVIVGIPWSIEGTETDKTKETLAFLNTLKEHLSVPVIGADERYSTSEANQLLKEMGYDWKKARTVIDSMAACMILKGYMERNADNK